jgi:hypothetical protein
MPHLIENMAPGGRLPKSDNQGQGRLTLRQIDTRKITCEPNDSSRSSLRYRPPL